MLVELEKHAELAAMTIVLNRPAKLNALSMDMLRELESAVDEIDRGTVGEVRLVMIRSSSERAFSVGADIKDWSGFSPAEAYLASQKGAAVFDKIAALKMPVIAILDKWVLGGGLELALACDLRIAFESAVLGFPEAKLGNAPGWAGVTRLVPLIGVSRAKEMLFTGRQYHAKEAERIGLVDFAGTPEEVEEKLSAWSHDICANAPIPLMMNKRLINEMAPNVSLFSFIESLGAGFTAGTSDSKAGKQAYFDKTAAKFTGN
jgi:enoyl-CoA hydratase/carnithine racemase